MNTYKTQIWGFRIFSLQTPSLPLVCFGYETTLWAFGWHSFPVFLGKLYLFTTWHTRPVLHSSLPILCPALLTTYLWFLTSSYWLGQLIGGTGDRQEGFRERVRLSLPQKAGLQMNQGCLCVLSFLWEALLPQFGSLWMSALPWQLLLLRLETQAAPNSFLPGFMKSSVCNPFLACYRRYVFGSFWKPELNPRGGDHHKHLSRSLHSVVAHLWVSGISAVLPFGVRLPVNLRIPYWVPGA